MTFPHQPRQNVEPNDETMTVSEAMDILASMAAGRDPRITLEECEAIRRLGRAVVRYQHDLRNETLESLGER